MKAVIENGKLKIVNAGVYQEGDKVKIVSTPRREDLGRKGTITKAGSAGRYEVKMDSGESKWLGEFQLRKISEE